MAARKKREPSARAAYQVIFNYQITLPNGAPLDVQLSAAQIGDILKHESSTVGKSSKTSKVNGHKAAPEDEVEDFFKNGLGQDEHRFNFISRMYDGDAMAVRRAGGKLKDVFEAVLQDYKDKRPELMELVEKAKPILNARRRGGKKPAGVNGAVDEVIDLDEDGLEREEAPPSVRIEMPEVEPAKKPRRAERGRCE